MTNPERRLLLCALTFGIYGGLLGGVFEVILDRFECMPAQVIRLIVHGAFAVAILVLFILLTRLNERERRDDAAPTPDRMPLVAP